MYSEASERECMRTWTTSHNALSRNEISTQLMNTKYSSAKRKSSEIHQVRQLTIEKGQT